MIFYLFFMEILELALNSITFLSNREKNLLKKNIDSLDKLALLSIEDISSIIGRSTKCEWNGPKLKELVKRALSIMESKQIYGVSVTEEHYPAMLRTINDPPYCFFYRGNLEVLKKKCVSVVGTRRIKEESARAAMDFAKDAALNGQLVVSGLAYGVDTFAHKGALQAEVPAATAAVLPCGIDSAVPYGNRALAASILKNGGLLCSEYIPGTPAEPWRFVQRNRLIAALSPATVVIHAPDGSGALITADFALNYNRDVVFHKAGIEAESETKKQGLENKKSRLPSAEHYLAEGAPVIENYADYVRVMENPPGTFSVKDRQPELF